MKWPVSRRSKHTAAHPDAAPPLLPIIDSPRRNTLSWLSSGEPSKRTKFLWLIALGAGMLCSGVVTPYTARSQTTNSWIDSNGKWEAAANWSLGNAPSVSDPADLITNVGNNIITIDAATSGSYPATMTVTDLIVGANTLSLSSAGLTI